MELAVGRRPVCAAERTAHKLESSLVESDLPESVSQLVLVISSLLLALVTGFVTQLGFSWVLGPSWASSLGVRGRGLECSDRPRQCRKGRLIQEAPASGSAANSSGT